MDIVEIPTNRIDEDTDQPRYQFGEEALEELMRSIEELGLLSPIKVRTTAGGRYKIIYGNRRYKACKMLGKTAIPCIVSSATNEMDIYLEQIAENLTREGFSPIEEAEAFNKLLTDARFSSSVKFLSSKLGKPEAYIKNKCELLKFGNAVKKLIVSGTEIRKDRLTEEQLLPIKDLALEHRDPLALIIARDEMPVSDVKKIARLFKDPDISSGTKDKLLYKSGFELLQTWSTFQQNKAERAKPAEPKPAAKSGKAAKPDAAAGGTAGQAQAAGAGQQQPPHNAALPGQQLNAPGDAAEQSPGAANSGGASGLSGQAEGSGIPGAPGQGSSGASEASGQAGGLASGPSGQTSGVGMSALSGHADGGGSAASTKGQQFGSPIEARLQALLAALPGYEPLPADIADSIASSGEADRLLDGIDTLIDSLEHHLKDWKAVREGLRSFV